MFHIKAQKDEKRENAAQSKNLYKTCRWNQFNADAFDRVVDPFPKHNANTRNRPMIGPKNVLEKACMVKVLAQNLEV